MDVAGSIQEPKVAFEQEMKKKRFVSRGVGLDTVCLVKTLQSR